jgi:hypothetical protein
LTFNCAKPAILELCIGALLLTTVGRATAILQALHLAEERETDRFRLLTEIGAHPGGMKW